MRLQHTDNENHLKLLRYEKKVDELERNPKFPISNDGRFPILGDRLSY
jgi:hypothetical protein